MAIDPSIALGVKPIELPNQLAQYGQLAAIQNAQNQNALAQYQLGAARRAEEKDIARTNALAKAGADPDAIEKALLETGDIKTYAEVRKARRETDAAGVKLLTDKLALLPEAYKRADTPEAYLALHKSVHADPVVGPWLSSIGATPEKGLATLDNAIKTGKFDDLRVQSMQSVSQLLEGLKPTVVGASSSVFNPKTGTFSQAPAAPATPTNLAKLQSELAALPPGDPRRPQYEALIRKEISHAPGTTVMVNTAKQYGESFGGKLADVDIGKMTTAEKAPQLAESANRIIGIVKQGNVFTGPIADVKLNVARALNVAGANNQEKIANTESLIAATGQSTLDAIKGAGLGTGQGFTDKDLKFLQGVAGGTINLTAQTLTELATLQHRAATRSADAWNARVKEMPQEVVKGTGISTAPIKVAPLSSIMGKPASTVPAPAGVDPALWSVMTPQEQKLWLK